MSISIRAFEEMTPEAIKHFWGAREIAAQKQRERGGNDQGNRAGVTAGKNLDVFIKMVRQLVNDNGIHDLDIHTDGRINLTIPGYYRPTKNWDLLVVSKGKLIAAIEFKSQVGPSFGNNFNNRVEEAIGNAVDLTTAFREGAFGYSQKPFVGYLFVLEDCDGSMKPVRIQSPHFDTLEEFHDTSYAQRYEILCRKLVHEQLYDAASLLLTGRESGQEGGYHELSEMTSGRRFAITLAGKVASIAAE